MVTTSCKQFNVSCPHHLCTIFINNGIQLADLSKKRGGRTARYGAERFEQIYRKRGIEHGLIPIKCIASIWTDEPKRFTINPFNHSAGIQTKILRRELTKVSIFLFQNVQSFSSSSKKISAFLNRLDGFDGNYISLISKNHRQVREVFQWRGINNHFYVHRKSFL